MLCYNPHCGENNTIGREDFLIRKLIKSNFKGISGPYQQIVLSIRDKIILYIFQHIMIRR